MRLFIDNWRWAGVPFYLRTGKRLPRRVTEVAVQFKRAPLMLFKDTPVHALSSNALVLRIQPDEGISLCFDAKVPGPFERLDTVTMNFNYAEYFKTAPPARTTIQQTAPGRRDADARGRWPTLEQISIIAVK